jgi:hypothetical protein
MTQEQTPCCNAAAVMGRTATVMLAEKDAEIARLRAELADERLAAKLFKEAHDKEVDSAFMKGNILAWFSTGEVGLSSAAMATRIAGISGGGKNHPHDPDDLNRCLLFLAAVPEARQHMDKLRSLSPVWSRLVDRWDEIEDMFLDEVGFGWEQRGKPATETYRLMLAVIEQKEPA